MKEAIKPKSLAAWPGGLVRWASLIICLVLFFGGLITVGSPNRQLPVALGWVMLALAAIVVISTMGYWVHLLPVLFGYGALNGLISAMNGHLGTDASKPISRVDGVMIAACFIGCALLSIRFRRPITLADRLGLLGAFAAVVFGAFGAQASLTASVLMFFSVFAAVLFDMMRIGSLKRGASL